MEVEPDTSQKTALGYGKLVVQGPKLDSYSVCDVKLIKVIASSCPFLLYLQRTCHAIII